jgi:5-methylcytosine-specific restriction endonuclease McrA
MCNHTPTLNDRFEQAIRTRDRNQCQVCRRHESEGIRLEIHRIVPTTDGDGQRMSNYILLCEKHHEEAHAPALGEWAA